MDFAYSPRTRMYMDQLAEFKIRIHGDLLAWLKRQI